MIPLSDGCDDLEESNLRSWVPQAAPQEIQLQSYSNSDMFFGGQVISFKGSNKDVSHNIKKWTDDNSFAVPQIINPPPTAGSKRYRQNSVVDQFYI